MWKNCRHRTTLQKLETEGIQAGFCSAIFRISSAKTMPSSQEKRHSVGSLCWNCSQVDRHRSTCGYISLSWRPRVSLSRGEGGWLKLMRPVEAPRQPGSVPQVSHSVRPCSEDRQYNHRASERLRSGSTKLLELKITFLNSSRHYTPGKISFSSNFISHC